MLSNVTFLFLLSMYLISCDKSNNDKAKESIRTYLNENLDDMSTYEPVKFGSLDTLFKLDVSQTKYPNSGKKYLYRFQMFHSYRSLDENGRRYLEKSYFILNDKLEVIGGGDNSVENWKNVKQSGIPSEIDINEFLHLTGKDTTIAKGIGCYTYINSNKYTPL